MQERKTSRVTERDGIALDLIARAKNVRCTPLQKQVATAHQPVPLSSKCRVVQLVAHQILDLGVLGSSPSAAAMDALFSEMNLRVMDGILL
jgi:regulation of enolase protein 1 (concanavalin A-like superfamily)